MRLHPPLLKLGSVFEVEGRYFSDRGASGGRRRVWIDLTKDEDKMVERDELEHDPILYIDNVDLLDPGYAMCYEKWCILELERLKEWARVQHSSDTRPREDERLGAIWNTCLGACSEGGVVPA